MSKSSNDKRKDFLARFAHAGKIKIDEKGRVRAKRVPFPPTYDEYGIPYDDREPTGPPQVFAYGRMSTAGQADSPEVQRAAVNARAQALGLPEPLFFLDSAVSGTTTLADRKAGREMCARLRRGDIVIIAKLDRAFRSLRDCANQLHIWIRMGVSVQLCDLGFALDLKTPWGKAMANLIGTFAELERDIISARTKEGLDYIKKLGHKHCRDPGYGYKWVKKYSPERGKDVFVRAVDQNQMRFLRWLIKAREELHMTFDQIRIHLTENVNFKMDGIYTARTTLGYMYRRACELREKGIL